MKKIALAAAMSIALAGVAKADWVDYVAVGGGYTQAPDLGYDNNSLKMDYGFHGGIMAGWNQSEDISLAADVMFTQSEYDGFSDDLQSISFMLDAIYTCDTGEFWHPFIGAGAGGVYLRFHNVDLDSVLLGGADTGTDVVFGYQGMAGVSFDVDEKHAIYVGYRYQTSSDASIKGHDVEYTTHNISVGVLFD
jgi:opacity protein-like surface antigen